jgi:hypothetical protein
MTRAGHGGPNPVIPKVGGDSPSSTYEEAGPVVPSGDARLQDPQVLDEIELYGELVIAASASEEPMSRAEIDQVLGLDRGEGESRSA